MWILEPISIATQGYVGLGPGPTGFCPAPLAIGSHGYIRFEVGDRRDGDGGHGAVILEPRPYEEPKKDLAKLALIAVIAIEENYD